MDLNELLAAFETEAADVVAANTTKSEAQAALASAQEAVASANTALATEKSEARAALDAVVAKLNEMAEELGI